MLKQTPTPTCRIQGKPLSSAVPEPVKQLCRILKDNDKQCYVVGGATRDLLMGEDPHDWDLTTDARPEEMENIFSPLPVVATGLKQGTMTVYNEGEGYEVTTFRIDGPYRDKIRPEWIEYADNLEDDLERRDLSVNAIAYDPLTDTIFTSPGDGIDDLKKRLIRAPGDPAKRFDEHPIRLLRACRFKSRLQFDMDPETEQAMKELANLIDSQPREAIGKEIQKILTQSDKPSIGFDCLRDSGILAIILPELQATVGVEQPGEYHEHDVYGHIMAVLDATPRDNEDVRWSALFHDMGKPPMQKWVEEKGRYMFIGHEDVSADMAKHIMMDLGFSKKKAEKVANLVQNHMFQYDPSWGPKGLRKFVKKVGEENLEDLWLLNTADIIGSGKMMEEGLAKQTELRERLHSLKEKEGKVEFSENDLAINGYVIMDFLDIPPGPQIRQVKEYLFDKVLEDPTLNNESDLKRLMTEIRCGL